MWQDSKWSAIDKAEQPMRQLQSLYSVKTHIKEIITQIIYTFNKYEEGEVQSIMKR